MRLARLALLKKTLFKIKQTVRVLKSRKPHYFQTELNWTPPSGMDFFAWNARKQRLQRIGDSIETLFCNKLARLERLEPFPTDDYPSESGDGYESKDMEDPLPSSIPSEEKEEKEKTWFAEDETAEVWRQVAGKWVPLHFDESESESESSEEEKDEVEVGGFNYILDEKDVAHFEKTTEKPLKIGKDISIVKLLGSGGFGRVFSTENEKEAVKVTSFWEGCDDEISKEKRTLQFFTENGHPSIIHLEKAPFRFAKSLVFVFPRIFLNCEQFADLENGFGEHMDKFLPKICGDVLRGLSHLHHFGYTHLDLKPQNICVDLVGEALECKAKLIDLGSAVTHTEALQIAGSKGQTFDYQSPESIIGGLRASKAGIPISPKHDIWSFGCILAEFGGDILGKPLFLDEKLQKIKSARERARKREDRFHRLCIRAKVIGKTWDSIAQRTLFETFKKVRKLLNSDDFDEIDTLRSHFCEERDDIFQICQRIFKWHPRERPSAAELLEKYDYFQ